MKKILYVLFLIFILQSAICNLLAQWHDAYISDFKVNDDMGNQIQADSKIGVDSAGNFVICWYDERNYINKTQVFVQRFDKNGLALGNNFAINNDTTQNPLIAMFTDGKFIIGWIRLFNQTQRYEFYFQRFNNMGNPINAPTRVIDSSFSGSFPWEGTALGSDSSGKFIYVWSKSPNSAFALPNVFFQRYDSSGSRIGSPQIVNESSSRAFYPQIAVNKDGSYIICWQDDRNSSQLKWDVYMQRYNNAGIKIGNNVKVNDDNDTTKVHQFPSISSDGKGDFVISWSDYRFGSSSPYIYYQLYDSNSTSLGSNRQANTIQNSQGVGFSRVSMRNDEFFFISWADWNYTGTNKFYGRRFYNTGNPFGNSNSPYLIPVTSPANSGPGDVAIIGDRIYSVWEDTRNGNTDIYCNIKGFQNPDTVVGIKPVSNMIDKFSLDPAYPNPFNPTTIIKYDLPKDSKVNIKIYDILGRIVKELVNETKQAGSYSVTFDGSNFASGVYFYRIEANENNGKKYINSKKMVLIK